MPVYTEQDLHNGVQGNLSSSFSGSDIQVMLGIPGKFNNSRYYEGTYIQLGNLQTLSYSMHREVFPVRSLGPEYGQNPQTFTRGPRTCAGTLIWTVLDLGIFERLYKIHESLRTSTEIDPKRSKILEKQADITPFVRTSDRDTSNNTEVKMDQLLPFDLYITFQNEVGTVMAMELLGLRITDDSMVLSSNDILTEQTMSFVCREIKLPYVHESYKTSYNPSASVSSTLKHLSKGDPARIKMGEMQKYSKKYQQA